MKISSAKCRSFCLGLNVSYSVGQHGDNISDFGGGVMLNNVTYFFVT